MYIFYLIYISSCYFHVVFVSAISIKLRPYVFVSFSIILNSHFYSLDLKQYKTILYVFKPINYTVSLGTKCNNCNDFNDSPVVVAIALVFLIIFFY